MRSALLLLASLSALLAQPVDDKFFFEQGKIRVLVLTGRNNHNWRATTPFLRGVLADTGKFDVRVTEEPAGLTAETLQPYDVLVVNYCGPRWSHAAEQAVEQFVRNGKGMVVVHAASYPFGDTAVLSEKMGRTDVHQQPWPEWAKMVGAKWSDEDPKTGHAQYHVYEVEWTDAAHPIAQGMPPSFRIGDELYHNFRMNPDVHVLAAALDAKAIGGTGKQEPLLWTVAYGKGRVFHTALGHDLSAMQAPGFVASFARGTEWAARGAVTLPAAVSLDPKVKDAIRVLLVTGGHDHAPSFYGVFQGNPGMTVNVDPHPFAFRRDIRKDYDVLVLYDSIQDLPEAQKKNLQDFVEAGKGVVILHHAIVDLGSWPWWWKEVVGGLYVSKAEAGMPASTYLHDVELDVRPAGKHPITKGLTRTRLFDETYKQVWMAPGVTPLLETEHPTSDLVIGWVSPFPKSRVVYLQPGHGPEAHASPWYRQLVWQAIQWSAGRM